MYFILTMNASHSGIISVLFYLPLSFCTYLFFFMLFLISKFIFSMILVDLLPWCVRFDGHSSLNWWLLANQRKYLWMGLSKCSSRAERVYVWHYLAAAKYVGIVFAQETLTAITAISTHQGYGKKKSRPDRSQNRTWSSYHNYVSSHQISSSLVQ